MRRRLAALLLAVAVSLPAEAAEPPVRGVPVLETPAFLDVERVALRLAQEGGLDAAGAALDAAIRRWPEAPRLQADRAAIHAAKEEDAAAFDALSRAVALGLDDLAARLALPPLDRIAGSPNVAALAAAAPEPRPAAPAEPPPPRRIDMAQALVDESNVYWEPRLGALVARFEALPAMRRFPIVDGRQPPPPVIALQRLVGSGQAAGNVGDLYDNRDDGHSNLLAPDARTQMSRVVYSEAARAAGLHYGLHGALVFDAPTIGNSSTALTGGPLWRSHPRGALVSAEGAARLWRSYAANQIYVYPEHRDHDPATPKIGADGRAGREGDGDVFPANTPYVLISQGSSGSDRPFLEALRAILAAFRPETKAFLRARGLIGPAVQSVFRRGQAGMGAEDYFTAAAHPVVFDAARIDLAAMIDLAQAIQPEGAPGQTFVAVESEEGGEDPAGSIPGAGPAGERLFDTPAAAARLWRGPGVERRYVLSAAGTRDPNGRPLRFRWLVAQGAPEAVTLRPLDETGTRAELSVRWTGPAPTALRPDIESSRIDVVVIAENGATPAAPAFFSLLLPTHEARVYAPDGRLLSIDAEAGRRAGGYADPALWPRRPWEDEFAYDEAGRLIGWGRKPERGRRARFTAQGLLVRETDASGRPILAEAVAWRVLTGRDRLPRLESQPTGRLFRYRYESAGDRVGAPEPAG